ncbi:uncharacterized protein LOC127261287 isoform X1 [Andrographis paniculata]|uniref:uncharacterized protein LOC127261287 isoform X1 n=1 Tax=Andrographis paniculata TaxID=175694 RepID=UPI0021E73F66|nr:uncharacterized protein LOC127261287 isoform X1 [Andrographis paniculata]XP_051145524.1 uncharacterized protein LOC127261287 isoform X1 [Andrographis paniculata]
MNHSVAAAAAAADRCERVVCPKPRRLGLPLRWHSSNQQEAFDSKAGNELLDIIVLAKGEFGSESEPDHVATSPPFFCGSPPGRASNPLIQDSRFMEGIQTPISNPSPSPRKGGCNPTVRVEGFDCLDRDRGRGCSIPALA